jgi:hypothetical protein
MPEPERVRIKRVGMVVETVNGELFTVFTRTPAGMTMNRNTRQPPPWVMGDTLMIDPPEVTLDVSVEEMASWVISMYGQDAQRARLDDIEKGLHL